MNIAFAAQKSIKKLGALPGFLFFLLSFSAGPALADVRTIQNFSVTPANFCPGDTVQVSFDICNDNQFYAPPGDVIVVMEKRHKERLRQKYPTEFAAKPCVCLFITDDYEFMDSNLIEILRGKMREHFPAVE